MATEKQIKVTQEYKDNIVWGSIDPNTGEINLYPNDISELIENAFKEGHESLCLENYYNSEIHFKKLYQTTKTGYRHIFRDDIGSYELIGINGEEDYPIIKKNVVLNKNYDAWYLDRKTSHIGFLADISGSMSYSYMGLMEKAIEFFLIEQSQLDNETLLYAGTFANNFNILYEGVDLKKIEDLQDKFYSQKTGGSTAYYDSITTLVKKIEEEFIPGDEVVICTVTDGQDNVSHDATQYSVSELISKKEKEGLDVYSYW